MARAFGRRERLASLIQAEIAKLVQLELRDQSLPLITITGVQVSPDLTSAKIYFVTHNEMDIDTVKNQLKQSKKKWRALLAKRIYMRKTPELQFIYDDSIARGNRIEQLLKTSVTENS